MTIRATSLSVALLLTACAANPPVSEQEGTVAAGYGRVFGRVQYIYNSIPTRLGQHVGESHNVSLFVRSLDTGELHYMRVEGAGDYSWPLKPGKYVVIGYTVKRTAGSYSEGITRRLMAPVTVPEPGAAVYIGDLRVQSDSGSYRTGWVDAYEATLKRASEKLAAGKFSPTKGVLRPERPPGTFSEVRPICAQFWGLTCTEANQGLEAIQPNFRGTISSFPVTDSLSPLFEWKPPARTDVTYDIAVYESISFEYLGGRVERMLGSQVAYAEGLTEPKFRPTTPLAPSKKYEWSVRLRQGDVVSTWSTTGYSFDVFIAARSATGQFFAFETPFK